MPALVSEIFWTQPVGPQSPTSSWASWVSTNCCSGCVWQAWHVCAKHQHMILSWPGTRRKPRLLGVVEVAMGSLYVQNSKEGKAAIVATLFPGTFGTSTSHKMQIASLLHPGPLRRPPQRYLPATWDLCPRLGGPYHVHCYFCEVPPLWYTYHLSTIISTSGNVYIT